mmetsp:Transcript_19398/g.58541  ORF Transcript_19398/g.58541 Transcript_19398/m.58541 type:complete len:204 (+) Transcript_19398:2064-2675(+)
MVPSKDMSSCSSIASIWARRSPASQWPRSLGFRRASWMIPRPIHPMRRDAASAATVMRKGTSCSCCHATTIFTSSVFCLGCARSVFARYARPPPRLPRQSEPHQRPLGSILALSDAWLHVDSLSVPAWPRRYHTATVLLHATLFLDCGCRRHFTEELCVIGAGEVLLKKINDSGLRRGQGTFRAAGCLTTTNFERLRDRVYYF